MKKRNIWERYDRKETPEEAKFRQTVGNSLCAIIVSLVFLVLGVPDLYKLQTEYPIVKEAIIEDYSYHMRSFKSKGLSRGEYELELLLENGDDSLRVYTEDVASWGTYNKGDLIEVRCPENIKEGDYVPMDYIAMDYIMVGVSIITLPIALIIFVSSISNKVTTQK